MDFGDIIWIVLMVGSVVASIIKKKMDSDKKANAPKRKIPDVMKEFFPDLGSVDEERESDIEEELMPKPAVESIGNEQLKYPNNKKYFTYDNIAEQENQSLIPDNEDPLYSNDSYSELKDEESYYDIDLRKAIIYAEIIRRPDY